jgi:predicted enzyme related to lactoylglutathione lyase
VTNDIRRAARFYGAILALEIEVGETSPGYFMAAFPVTDGIGGALMQGAGYVPSTAGTLVYLACTPNLDTVLNRVKAAGGKITQPKTDIGEHGVFAFILAAEGNQVGLHAMS